MQERQQKFEYIIEACEYMLHNDSVAEPARAYINSRLPLETQKKYQIGFFPDNNTLKNIYSIIPDKKFLFDVNLVYPRYISGGVTAYALLGAHNLVMPFRDVYGNVVSLLGRTLLSEDERKALGLQKYKYSFGANKELHVFGLDKARDAIIEKDFVICVEGQFDCIACHNSGINNVVALGWANMTRYQLFQVTKYTKNVYLMMDQDEAGKKAAKKIKGRFGKHANIKTITVPGGFKDVDEYLRAASVSQEEKSRFIAWINKL